MECDIGYVGIYIDEYILFSRWLWLTILRDAPRFSLRNVNIKTIGHLAK